MRTILASKSPRRKELLEQIGLEFEIKVSDVEEIITTNIPHKLVEELSRQKAEAVLKEVLQSEFEKEVEGTANSADILIIGADTVVSIDGRILGKPADGAKAVEMLRTLSGRTHQVYTGVTLIYCPRDNCIPSEPCHLSSATKPCHPLSTIKPGTVLKTFHEKTDVTFFALSEEEIAGYVVTGDCMDKAGAYGIQGFCARYIQGINGDYNNVVGLPVGRLYQEAKEWLDYKA